jgi:hypothetical protein
MECDHNSSALIKISKFTSAHLYSFAQFVTKSTSHHAASRAIAASATGYDVTVFLPIQLLLVPLMLFRYVGHVPGGLYLTLRVIVGVAQRSTAGLRNERTV